MQSFCIKNGVNRQQRPARCSALVSTFISLPGRKTLTLASSPQSPEVVGSVAGLAGPGMQDLIVGGAIAVAVGATIVNGLKGDPVVGGKCLWLLFSRILLR